MGRIFGLGAALVMAVGCGSAGAASPVLEFESQSSALPFQFEAQGGEVTAVLSDFDTVVHCEGSRGLGEIVGPRTAFSTYSFTGCETLGGTKAGHECKSATALPNEIQTPVIEAELVFIDQARNEVGVLLAPHGGVYMEFECGRENVKAIGPFVSPVGPINQEGTSFTASLFRSGATQVPSAYESLTGEILPAIPTGETEHMTGTTGVELSFAIHTFQPLAIKAITAAELDAKQRDEEAAKAAAEKKRAEEEATKKRQEEELAKEREAEKAKAKARARQLSKALKQCRRADSKHQRVRRVDRRRDARVRRPPRFVGASEAVIARCGHASIRSSARQHSAPDGDRN
ncbi:MAG TPA: hypothetical protein VGH14_02505 [Solirubrobacterales bacterium]